MSLTERVVKTTILKSHKWNDFTCVNIRFLKRMQKLINFPVWKKYNIISQIILFIRTFFSIYSLGACLSTYITNMSGNSSLSALPWDFMKLFFCIFLFSVYILAIEMILDPELPTVDMIKNMSCLFFCARIKYEFK